MTCRACKSELRPVLNLGVQPLANALLLHKDDEEPTFPLNVLVCPRCALLQTDLDVPAELIFNDAYPYFSGQSAQWVEHCKTFAREAIRRFELTQDSFVIEVGGNDGTLLKQFNCMVRNIEPSQSVAQASADAGIPTVMTRWEDFHADIGADLIIANNVLCHTPDLAAFIGSFARNLAPSGVLTMEFPWVVNLLAECQFDTLYHEHYSYFSLSALLPLLSAQGLTAFDVERVPTHGGSLRVYICKHSIPSNAALQAVLDEEAVLFDERTYRSFRERAFWYCEALQRFTRAHRKFYAYGAAAKGNTLLNWCGVTADDIVAVADTTPAKQGKFLPGSRIPIISEERLLEIQPSVVLVLPWNWKSEIVGKLAPQMPQTAFYTPRDLL